MFFTIYYYYIHVVIQSFEEDYLKNYKITIFIELKNCHSHCDSLSKSEIFKFQNFSIIIFI